uniref:Uncharacterized protein n=1 Tax=viral metagenome TaxID=1070528 RepID=A0A6H1ZLP8_9ZZZZ
MENQLLTVQVEVTRRRCEEWLYIFTPDMRYVLETPMRPSLQTMLRGRPRMTLTVTFVDGWLTPVNEVEV